MASKSSVLVLKKDEGRCRNSGIGFHPTAMSEFMQDNMSSSFDDKVDVEKNDGR